MAAPKPAVVNPVLGHVVQGGGRYGYRTHPVTGKRGDFHAGQDIANVVGTPILAPFDGQVVAAGRAGRGLSIHRTGLHVIIRSKTLGVDFYAGHCHELHLKAGLWVKAGQVVADVGNTGNSTGPHAHVEIRDAGTLRTRHPVKWFNSHGVRLGRDPQPGPDPEPEAEPEPERKVPDMLILLWGKTRYRLIAGDRMVGLTEEGAQNFINAGLPVVGVNDKDYYALQSALIYEGTDD